MGPIEPGIMGKDSDVGFESRGHREVSVTYVSLQVSWLLVNEIYEEASKIRRDVH